MRSPIFLNRKRIRRFTVIFCLACLLAVTIQFYSRDKITNQKTIEKLNKKIEKLNSQVSFYKAYQKNEKKRLSFFHFKENVFSLRYPEFSKIIKIVFKKSKEYSFNPYLTMAIIQVESGFQPYVISSAGAYGLMQINYSVWKNELKIDLNRIFEIEYNIDLGLKVLKHYYDNASGNMFIALFRYNNGYKYNNTNYNGKIIATRFYSNRNKANQKPKKKSLSI